MSVYHLEPGQPPRRGSVAAAAELDQCMATVADVIRSHTPAWTAHAVLQLANLTLLTEDARTRALDRGDLHPLTVDALDLLHDLFINEHARVQGGPS